MLVLIRLALVNIVALGLLLIACEPGRSVEYTNYISQRVIVSIGGTGQFDLEPGELVRPATAKKYYLPDFKVVSEDGRVLLEEHITYDEVGEMGYKIVFTDLDGP